MSSADLYATFAALRGVEGWLSADQVVALHAAAARAPAGGQVVEIGSFRGRSAIALSLGAPSGASVVCVDPHAGSDRGPQEILAQPGVGADDHDAFEANLRRAGVRDRVRHVRTFSGEALGAVPGAIDVLFVDGAHRYAPALDDLRRWGDRVPPGGTLLVHDSFSSIGVTLALLRHVVGHRGWRYRGRVRSLAVYERAPNTVGSVLAQLAQLPWFARNVLVKVLLVAGQARAARLLGHRDGPWPY